MIKKNKDQELGKKLRQISRELEEWANLAEKDKLSKPHIERMRLERLELLRLISNKEL